MKRMIAIVGALLITAALLYVLACDDNSTGPKPEPEEKDYVVWMHNRADYGHLIGYHPSTGQLDTLRFGFTPPKSFIAISASADGDRVYCTIRFDSIAVVSAVDGDLIRWLPFPSQETVYVSRDGAYLAIVNQDLTLLDASSYEVIFQDTSRIPHYCSFSSDSEHMYAPADTNSYSPDYIYHLDMSATPFLISRVDVSYLGISEVVPSGDRSRWLLYLVNGGVGGFVVYDTLLDTTIFEDWLYPGIGSIAITPNGKLAFYTNPGGGIYPVGESLIRAYDIDANQVVAEIVANDHGDTSAPQHCPIQQMVITPDGRYLVGLDYPGYDQLICYDIKTGEIVDYRYFGESTDISNLTVQLQP